jgi:flagellar P-ring protein precursor FlgI
MSLTRRRSSVLVLAAALTAALAAGADRADADRIKDLATIDGVRGNALVGYGLVIGLAGTGDDASSPMVKQSLSKMLKQVGISIPPEQIKAKNVAAVIVTAELPPFARSGQRIDVVVSSTGGAKSLAGGTLVMTPLKSDGPKTWALAQGPIAVGGFLVEAGAGAQRKNHITTGRIPGGAMVEGEVPTEMPAREIVLLLNRPDFTTATRIAGAIESAFGAGTASARDAGSVVVDVGKTWRGKVPSLIAAIEALEATPDELARVVVDERTGTVVVGGEVRLTAAAIAYGGLEVAIVEDAEVSQPAPRGRGDTKVVPHSDIQVHEPAGELRTIAAAASVADVAHALNALGAKPRDLIAILQALAHAGALHARLEVM